GCREPAYWTSTWATEDTALRRFAAPRSMSVVPGATTDRRVRFRRRYSNLDDAMADTVSPALSAFYFFADTPRRRAALHAAAASPERPARRHGPARRLHLAARRRVDRVVAYSAYEAEMIREGIGSASGARVVFVPFGVDTVFFHPAAGEPDAEVVSVGADPH